MSSKTYYVYALINPKTDKPFYIGKGTGKRCKFHLSAKYSYSKNKRLCLEIDSIRRTGDEILINVLHDNLDEDTAYSLETTIIKQYGRIGYEENGILANYQIKGGKPPSMRGHKHSTESKAKMSVTRQGSIPWNKGKTGCYSEETLLKMKQASRKISDETRLKMSKSKIGTKHKQPMSDAQKEKLSKLRSQNWRVTFPNGEIRAVENLRQFALDHNIHQGNLVHRGKSKGYLAEKA